MKFVLLAGGSGSRLWPLSTQEKPKQFQSFLSDRTLFQQALDRVKFAGIENIYVATTEALLHHVKEQAPEIPEKQIIIEPARRDTASAMSFATKYIASIHGEDETISMISTDHTVKNTQEFETKIAEAHYYAQENDKICIVEVTASSPNPNFGYAKIGAPISDFDDVYELDHFTEKPSIEVAKEYIKSYKYLWNTGMYTWKAKHLFKLLKQYTPEITTILDKITDFRNCKDIYETLPKISIDYALIEKTPVKEIWILPADLGWSDVGTWETLHQELSPSPESNIQEGDVCLQDCHSNIVINKESNKKLCLINLDNLAVINTPDAILVCPKSESASIKEMLKRINNNK